MKQIENFSSLSLDELESLNDYKLVKLYNDYLNKLITNKIRKSIVESNYGRSIDEIEEAIYMSEEEITSIFISPGDLLLYYDNAKSLRSRKTYICDLSREKIKPNELYYLYKPCIENISKKVFYVSKKAYRFREEYSDFIPKSLSQFEALLTQLEQASYGDCYSTEEKYNNIALDDLGSNLIEGIDFYRIRK